MSKSAKLYNDSNIKLNIVVTFSITIEAFMCIMFIASEFSANLYLYIKDIGPSPFSPEHTSNI